MVSTPKPPDPDKTAAAQGGLNRDTALTQQQINMVNQVGPDGSLTYNQTGNSSFIDSKGKTVSTPTYTATTTLSPAQMAIKAQTDAATNNIATLANNQSGFLTNYLAKPFEYTNKDAENFAYDLGKRRIDPRFETELDNQRTQLINSGIRPGTPAYDQAMTQFNQSKNDAYNELTLGSQQLGYNQALTTRNQPLNEISALMSGSQVSQPQFQQTPQANVAGVDYMGMVNSNYQAKLQQSQSAMGGLFGLASAGIKMLPFSDRRLKRNIHRIGTLRNGLGWYSYEYKWDDVKREGIMADEVKRVAPMAVRKHPSGFDTVDYALALEAA